jgi:hypothetical protein
MVSISLTLPTSTVSVHVGVGVSTVGVGGTGMCWSLSSVTVAHPVATADRPPHAATAAAPPQPDDVTRIIADAARVPPVADTSTNDAYRPTSTQGKSTFVDYDVGIPEAAHATNVATTTKSTAAFSIHKNGDDDWNLAPLVPMTLGNAAATGQYDHHVGHCGSKSWTYCRQVILKVKMNSILPSLTILIGFEEF